jgi:glucose-6-phosphate 1-epimerase
MIEVDNAHARARIALHGGQLLSFRPKAADASWLFLSPHAVFQDGQPIRGGVPICWPWFGPDPLGLGRPNHGFARTSRWTLLQREESAEGTQLVLGLRDTPQTRALWPHAFELRLELHIGATLRLALITRNSGGQPFEITQALHSYFAVSDPTQARVTGLDGIHYLDKAAGAPGTLHTQQGAVVFEGEVDRVYTGAPPTLGLLDLGTGRALQLHSSGSRSAVLWNPGPLLAARMADLGVAGQQRFVCVETANVAPELVQVAPGGEHRMGVEIRCTAPASQPS